MGYLNSEEMSSTFDQSLGLKDEVIAFQWSKVKVTLTLYESGTKMYVYTYTSLDVLRRSVHV